MVDITRNTGAVARSRKQAGGVSVPQREFIAQDVAAINLVYGGLALPTAAAHFAPECPMMLRHRLGQGHAQIEIATDAFMIRAREAK